MVEEDWVNGSTLYMPVTRELSAGKRLILQAWGDLVVRKYPQQPLRPISVRVTTERLKLLGSRVRLTAEAQRPQSGRRPPRFSPQ